MPYFRDDARKQELLFCIGDSSQAASRICKPQRKWRAKLLCPSYESRSVTRDAGMRIFGRLLPVRSAEAAEKTFRTLLIPRSIRFCQVHGRYLPARFNRQAPSYAHRGTIKDQPILRRRSMAGAIQLLSTSSNLPASASSA